jgi:hypothetical protein
MGAVQSDESLNRSFELVEGRQLLFPVIPETKHLQFFVVLTKRDEKVLLCVQ